MSSSKLRKLKLGLPSRVAVGVWLLGAVITAALAALVAGIIYDVNKSTAQSCISQEGVTYCSVAVETHTLVYLDVFGITAAIALATWTLCYIAYRLQRGHIDW